VNCYAKLTLALAGLLATTFAVHSENSRQTLSWQVNEDKDALTDVVTRKIVARAAFSDGSELRASGACGPIGVDFTLSMFRGTQAAVFAANKDRISLRVRIDDRPVRTATAEAKHANEISVLFYDPQAARDFAEAAIDAAASGVQSAGSTKSALVARELLQGAIQAYGRAGIGKAVAEIEARSAGQAIELQRAQSIRVELPLADGSANAIDLNPQDPTLKNGIQECISRFETNRQAAERKEAARRAAEKAEEQAKQARKDAECAVLRAKYSSFHTCVESCQKLTPDNSPKITPATAQCFTGCPPYMMPPDQCSNPPTQRTAR
jgi:hypothetical protein